MSCACRGGENCCVAKKPEWTIISDPPWRHWLGDVPADTASRVCDDIEHSFNVTKSNAGERILFCHKCGTTRSL